MTLKWKLLAVFVVLYLIGVAGGGWHTLMLLILQELHR